MRFTCGQCPYTTSKAKEFIHHCNKDEKKENPYWCRACCSPFETVDALVTHMQGNGTCTNIISFPLRCGLPSCEFFNKCPYKFTEHLKVKHKGILLLPCKDCDRSFTLPSFLIKHLQMECLITRKRFKKAPLKASKSSKQMDTTRHTLTNNSSDTDAYESSDSEKLKKYVLKNNSKSQEKDKLGESSVKSRKSAKKMDTTKDASNHSSDVGLYDESIDSEKSRKSVKKINPRLNKSKPSRNVDERSEKLESCSKMDTTCTTLKYSCKTDDTRQTIKSSRDKVVDNGYKSEYSTNCRTEIGENSRQVSQKQKITSRKKNKVADNLLKKRNSCVYTQESLNSEEDETLSRDAFRNEPKDEKCAKDKIVLKAAKANSPKKAEQEEREPRNVTDASIVTTHLSNESSNYKCNSSRLNQERKLSTFGDPFSSDDSEGDESLTSVARKAMKVFKKVPNAPKCAEDEEIFNVMHSMNPKKSESKERVPIQKELAEIRTRCEKRLYKTWGEWWTSITSRKSVAVLQQLQQQETYLLNFFKCMNFSCDYSTNNDEEFEKHQMQEHSRQKLPCMYCLDEYEAGTSLKEHTISAHGMRRYQCSRCIYRAASMAYVAVHAEAVHPGRPIPYECVSRLGAPHLESTKNLETEVFMPYKCGLCHGEYKTNDRETFISHNQELHFGISSYPCFYCEEKISNLNELLTHYYTYHCLYCTYGGTSGMEVMVHACLNHTEKPFQIYKNKCDSDSNNFGILYSGMVADKKFPGFRGEVPEEKVDPCPLCPKCFITHRESLMHQQKEHTNNWETKLNADNLKTEFPDSKPRIDEVYTQITAQNPRTLDIIEHIEEPKQEESQVPILSDAKPFLEQRENSFETHGENTYRYLNHSNPQHKYASKKIYSPYCLASQKHLHSRPCPASKKPLQCLPCPASKKFSYSPPDDGLLDTGLCSPTQECNVAQDIMKQKSHSLPCPASRKRKPSYSRPCPASKKLSYSLPLCAQSSLNLKLAIIAAEQNVEDGGLLNSQASNSHPLQDDDTGNENIENGGLLNSQASNSHSLQDDDTGSENVENGGLLNLQASNSHPLQDDDTGNEPQPFSFYGLNSEPVDLTNLVIRPPSSTSRLKIPVRDVMTFSNFKVRLIVKDYAKIFFS